MGIRYYARAFERDLADRAVADPRGAIDEDPLAVAWGLEPGSSIGFIPAQAPPVPDGFLYLDKAWGVLQALTGPTAEGPARDSFRMFEGAVKHHDRGWDPWFRTVLAEEMVAIATDLVRVRDSDLERLIRGHPLDDRDIQADIDWATHYLRAARVFAADCAGRGRGMVYQIG
jgi:hypothetical protein